MHSFPDSCSEPNKRGSNSVQNSVRHVYTNAICLMEGGKYSYAERLLEKLVQAGDIEAQLLMFDAKLYSGKAASAREIFETIDRNKILLDFRFPYAVAEANLVLLGGVLELRDEALSLLSSLPPTGGPLNRDVKKLLTLLSRVSPEAR